MKEKFSGIEEFKDIEIAYMRRTGAYGPGNNQLMDDFKAHLKEHNLLTDDSTILGIAMDDPIQTSPEKQRYDVGIIITDSEKKIDLPTRKIPDGRYAIFEVAHTVEGVSHFWENIQNLTSDLPVDNTKPIIERYASSKVSAHLCEFCVPVR